MQVAKLIKLVHIHVASDTDISKNQKTFAYFSSFMNFAKKIIIYVDSINNSELLL